MVQYANLAEHSRFEESLTENTELTKQLVINTQEIIAIIKGVKGFRTFMVWLTPFVVTIGAIIAWFRGH